MRDDLNFWDWIFIIVMALTAVLAAWFVISAIGAAIIFILHLIGGK